MTKQITLFDQEYTEEIKQHETEVVPYIGQKVKIQLPEGRNCEAYQYLCSYHNSILSKTGEVKEMKLYPSGKYTCTVDFFGAILFLNPENLYLM
ncbi:hypothetical protein ACMGD3_24045 [Lysinibacillus sphaericus]|uniref:hypothetical protein n=1 Tax=Lysinibacillus sphaericus TaxID=1421 RepID=UPI003F7A48BC